MRLSIEKITDVRQSLSLRLPADELNCQLLAAEVTAEPAFCSDALVEFQLTRVARRILLEGQLSARLDSACGRCLEPMHLTLREDFSLALNLVAQVAAEEGDDAADSELDEEQLNSLPVIDGVIDLRPVLLEEVLLRLPLHPVCTPECAGLCPRCGINLNQECCQCQPELFNNRFSQLKNLKIS